MNEQLYQKLLKEEDTRRDKYILKEGILYKKRNEQLLRVVRRFEIEPILYLMHDHQLSAHFGVTTTRERVKEKYFWPGMDKDIEDYVRSCDNCQRRGKRDNIHKLHSIEVKEPFYCIGIDFVGPLPLTENNNKHIIVAIDYFTKWPEARATKTVSSEEAANFIFEEIICRHGCPRKILTDRGTSFNNQLVRKLVERFNIKHNLSTPYHPKTNGLVERFNRTLCESLAKLGGEKNWDKNIAPVLYAYRTRKQESTKMKPFYLTYGREARSITNEENIQQDEYRIQYLVDEHPKVINQARENIKRSQEMQKRIHDKKSKEKVFETGEKVLYYKAIKDKQWTGKLEENWKGPYYVHEKLLNGAYKIKDEKGIIVKVPVNGELLKHYYSRESYIPYILIEPGGSTLGGESL
jgi:hypothetical protein